jgi:hypothetical protein
MALMEPLPVFAATFHPSGLILFLDPQTSPPGAYRMNAPIWIVQADMNSLSCVYK